MNFQRSLSYFVLLLSIVLMIASTTYNDFEFLAIMAGIYEIFYKIK